MKEKNVIVGLLGFIVSIFLLKKQGFDFEAVISLAAIVCVGACLLFILNVIMQQAWEDEKKEIAEAVVKELRD